jgi:anti-sigma factor RsiW
MTCRELTSFIGDYLAGELDADAVKKFERHLEVCPNCVQYLADYERAVQLGQRVYDESEEAAAGVPEELLNAILSSRTVPK